RRPAGEIGCAAEGARGSRRQRLRARQRRGSLCAPSPTAMMAPRCRRVLFDFVDESVGVTLGAIGAERHLALGSGEVAGAAGDREQRVAGVIERPFDGYLTLVQGQRPETLPRFAWHGADAVPL